MLGDSSPNEQETSGAREGGVVVCVGRLVRAPEIEAVFLRVCQQNQTSGSVAEDRLEITDGMGELIIRPRRYLGQTWEEINHEIRALGGKWFKGTKAADGSWRIPK